MCLNALGYDTRHVMNLDIELPIVILGPKGINRGNERVYRGVE